MENTQTLLVFEAHNMLTNSLRQRVEVRLTLDPTLQNYSDFDADITCLESKGSDAWYDIAAAVPMEIQRCNDPQRILEFLQDVLMSMGDELEKSVIGIRSDPHGLLDFLLPANDFAD